MDLLFLEINPHSPPIYMTYMYDMKFVGLLSPIVIICRDDLYIDHETLNFLSCYSYTTWKI